MKTQKNLTDRYIQLVETFITAIESGRTGTELEEIRSEIRTISAQLGMNHSVENSTQALIPDQLPKENKSNNEMEAYY